MNKSWFYLGVMSSLAIFITSCGGDGGKQATTLTPAASKSPTAVASPTTAAVPPTTPKPTPTAAKPLTVPAKSIATKAVSMNVAAGLIPPTDPDNWTKTVAKGRPDPFASLTLQPIQDPNLIKESFSSTGVKPGSDQQLPIIKIGSKVGGKPATVVVIKPAGAGKDYRNIDISQIPRSGIARKLPKITMALKPKSQSPNSTAAIRSASTSNIAIRPLPQPLKTSRSSTIVAPPKIEPKLARTVGVSGVIQVDGRTQVIVKLPNESFSRYVDVGSRISDGKIMVKRVEGEQTLSPIIVLEESGIEITRRVGDTNDAAAISNTNNNSSNVKIPPK
jgi:hypothetical protein